MKVHRRYVSALFLMAFGCRSGATPAAVEAGGEGSAPTGIEGIAHRGPTRPVCQLDKPCTAPFSASFEVRQGGRVVAGFQSDSAGHFLVALAPGSYMVVPDASAPLLARGQAHEVIVKRGGLTHVDLDFDTGIR